MEPAQVLVAILGSGGIGAAVVALVNGLIKWINGSAAREKEKNTSLIAQRRKAIEDRDEAFEERDREAARRRMADEYASSLRRKLIENGISPGRWYTERHPELEETTLDREEIDKLKKMKENDG